MANEEKNLVLFTEKGQLGVLAHMLQVDPPPKDVKITMSKRIPMVGDELKAYKDEHVQIKKEEMLKARLVKEGELKASQGSNANAFDPVVIDASSSQGFSNAGSRFGDNMDILIHGFIPPSTSVAPRFPLFENTTEWDDFGEIINTDDYMMKHEEMDSTLMFGPSNGLDTKIFEDSVCLLLDSTPSKIISSEVHVKCSLIYMDFEGRCDGRSIKSVIAHVAPWKLVHLSEQLMSNVMPKKIGELEIAWVDAEVGKEDEKLILNPPSATPPYRPVLVGDLKLADFKQFLENNGLQVEFAGGALQCGEYITLRKMGDSSQKIMIEGPLCEDYYKIRKLLYSQFYLL